MITGFKGRSISIEKIVKVSRDHLIKQAGSKYIPEMTVVKAKSLRLQASAEEQGSMESKQEELRTEEASTTSPHQQTAFVLPDSAQKINELIMLVQTNKGDQEITIGNKTFLLTGEGIQKIHALLAK